MNIRIVKNGCLLLAFSLFIFGVMVLNNAGEFTDIEIVHPKCKAIPGMQGVEDLVVLPNKDFALAVGGDRRSFRLGGKGSSRVWMIPLDSPIDFIEVPVTSDRPIHGFGSDVYEDIDGNIWLLVANRYSETHSISVFRVLGEFPEVRIEHQYDLKAEGFDNPNDLVAVSPVSAIVTLDKVSRAGSWSEILEGALRLKTGKVVKINQDQMSLVVDNLVSSNGVVLFDDGRLAVGELVGRSVKLYLPGSSSTMKDRADNRIVRIPLPFSVDNITKLDEQRLLVSGHPKLVTLARSQFSEETNSPSEVAIVDVETLEVTTVFKDDGTYHSSSSVAISDHRNGFIVGAAFGPSVSHCKLDI